MWLWWPYKTVIAGRANVGNYNYNNVQSDQAFINRLYHSTNYLLNSHTDVTKFNFQQPEYLSDHFVQEASFFRLDHITLSYQFNNLFQKGYSVGLSATMQNPMLITDYTGVDPEVVGGVDNNNYPRVRTFLIGLNANF